MKIQAVLFALLQAHAAAADGSVEDAPIRHLAELPSCALPCKTKLRLSPSKMKECINAECGLTIVENEANDHDLEHEEANSHVSEPPYSKGQCIAHCKRLRSTIRKQQHCIQRCDEEEDESRKKSNFDTNGKEDENEKYDKSPDGDKKSNIETEEEGDDEADDTDPTWNSRGECIAHCKKLRIRQDRCIADCPKDDDSDESSEKKSNLNADEDQESDQTDGTESDERSNSIETEEEGDDEADDTDPTWNSRGECIAHCKKLRIRQDRCIAGCPKDDNSDDSSEKKSNFGADEEQESNPEDTPTDADEEEESDPDNIPTPSDCVRHCQVHRLSITKQRNCIRKCPDEEPPKKSNVESNEEEDAADTDQGYTATS